MGGLDGYPASFFYIFAGLAAFAVMWDANVIRAGGTSGAARIARHLWRMCVALFFATGNFFIGQQKIMPEYARGSPVLFALGLAPLILLAFWMVRVRLTNWYRGD